MSRVPGPETHSFLWLERSPRGRGPFRALISSTIPPHTHTHSALVPSPHAAHDTRWHLWACLLFSLSDDRQLQECSGHSVKVLDK